MSVASKLSEHSRRNKTFGKAVSGMLLQMLDIGDGNGLKRLSDNMDQNESKIFQPLLQKFNCSFKQYKPKKDNCLALGIPSKPISYHLATKDRLKSNAEKRRLSTSTISIPNLKKPGRKPGKGSSCSFFKSTEHNSSRCPKKKSLGDAVSCDVLEKYILYHAPYSILDTSTTSKIINDHIPTRNGSKHLVVDQIHSKCTFTGQTRPPKEYMVATITLLDAFGIPVVGFDRAHVDLIKVIEYMYKYNSNKSRQFFSTIKRESVGKEFHSSIDHVQENI